MPLWFNKHLLYRRPSLFEDFLSANLLIHIGKISQKIPFFQSKIDILFVNSEFGSKMKERIYREICTYTLAECLYLHEIAVLLLIFNNL